jgi:ribosomal protein L22
MRPSEVGTTRIRVVGHNSQARLSQDEARRIFRRVHGLTAADALRALRFSAGAVCPPVARIVAQAVEEAGRRFGFGPDELVVSAGEVGRGETVIRVRRQAHGMADWITTETTDIRVELSPAVGTQTEGKRQMGVEQ